MNSKNIKSIELFGVSGCGKTYIRNKIINLFDNSSKKFFDTRGLITEKHKKVINLNFAEKQMINYFKVLKVVNINKITKKNTTNKKKTFNSRSLLNNITIKFKNKYEKICIKILNKDDKSKKIYKFILKILKQNKTKESKDYHFWFVELLAASCIVKKIKDDSNFIYFPDEGFLQRSFLINSILKDKDINKIKRYLKLVPKSEIIINIKSKKTKIQKVHFDRKKDSIGRLKSKAEIAKMFKFEKRLINDYANFDFEIIKNNPNLINVLKSYFSANSFL